MRKPATRTRTTSPSHFTALAGTRFMLDENAGGGAAPATPPADPAPTPTAPVQQSAPATPPVATPAATGITPDQLQSVTGPLMEQVRQSVADQLAPVTQAQAELRQQMEQLSAPRTGAGVNPFNVIVGESPNSSRGYQLHRVMGLRQGAQGYTPETCKIELEVHQWLHEAYVQRGGMTLEGNDSILVPYGTDMLLEQHEGGGDGLSPERVQTIRQAMGAGVEGWTPGGVRNVLQRALAMQPGNDMLMQALSQYDDSALGSMLGPTQRGELIDLVRAREVITMLGSTQLTLPPNGRLQFDRQTGAVTAYWVGEVPGGSSTPTITASEPASGLLSLIAKKLAVLVKVPNDLLRFATKDVEAFIRADAARVMALEKDLTALVSTGSSTRPKGILGHDYIAYTASTTGANGDTFEPEDVALMKVGIEEANHQTEDATAGWAMRPKMFANLRNRRAAAHTAATYDGGWLFPVNRDDLGRGTAPRLDGDRVAKSTQVPGDREKGASTDLTLIYYGIWRHLIQARAGVVEVARSVQGDTPFQTDQSWLRIIEHCDLACRYDKAFTVCDDVDMDLP